MANKRPFKGVTTTNSGKEEGNKKQRSNGGLVGTEKGSGEGP